MARPRADPLEKFLHHCLACSVKRFPLLGLACRDASGYDYPLQKDTLGSSLVDSSGSKKRVTMKRFLKRLTSVVILVVPLLGGCQSHTWLLYANPPATGEKEGQQCATVVFGLGPSVDFSGNEAIRLGGITKPRTVEYRMNSFHGMGRECILARGQ